MTEVQWTVRPIRKGESVVPHPDREQHVIAWWGDGSPRLVEEIWGNPPGRWDLEPIIDVSAETRLRIGQGNGIPLRDPAIRATPVRSGNLKVTFYYYRDLGHLGGLHLWLTATKGSNQLQVEMNWHNGKADAEDFEFPFLELVLPDGWKAAPVVPDPAFLDDSGAVHLIRPTTGHVFPRGMERPFWFTIYPEGELPESPFRGWVGSDWSHGYMPRNAPLPKMSGLSQGVRAEAELERELLRANRECFGATASDPKPPSAMWPCGGVRYGGMTGGFHRVDLPGCKTAIAGERDGLALAWIETLRYRCRMTDWVSYDAAGRPDGRAWKRRADWTNEYVEAGEKHMDTYLADLLRWDPIDLQHFDRMSRGPMVLAWLTGSNLAIHYLKHDGAKVPQLGFEDRGGTGSSWGREGANAVDLECGAYAFTPPEDREPIEMRLRAFRKEWVTAIMPSGSPIKTLQYKIVEDPPLGDGTGYGGIQYYGQRAEELAQVFRALHALQETTGLGCRNALSKIAHCIRDYAWRYGHGGCWQRIPFQKKWGAYYSSPDEWPADLVERMEAMGDGFTAWWQGGNAHYYGLMAGVDMRDTLYDDLHATSLADALAELKALGAKDLEQHAATLAWLQETVGAAVPQGA